MAGSLTAKNRLTGTLQAKNRLVGKFSIGVNPNNYYTKDEVDAKYVSAPTYLDFPSVGEYGVTYVALLENAVYRFDTDSLKYICIGRDFHDIGIINGTIGEE